MTDPEAMQWNLREEKRRVTQAGRPAGKRSFGAIQVAGVFFRRGLAS